MTTMKLTPTEFEIIKHRLDVPDCIWESLNEEHPGLHKDKDIADAIDAIDKQDWDSLADISRHTANAVLIDCVDGSTFCGSLEDHVAFGEITEGRRRSILKSAMSVAEKVSEFTGQVVVASLC